METLNQKLKAFVESLSGFVQSLREYVGRFSPPLPEPEKPGDTNYAPQPTPHVSRIEPWAHWIEEFEGYYVGSRSFRNKNPGNLKWTEYTKSLGAQGKDKDNFCIFQTYELGKKALCTFLTDAATNKLRSYKNCSLAQFFAIYDSSHPKEYSEYISGKMKIPLNLPISNLL